MHRKGRDLGGSASKEEEELKECNQRYYDHLSEESTNEALHSNRRTETKIRSNILMETSFWIKRLCYCECNKCYRPVSVKMT